MNGRLVFVYNANAGLLAGVLDSVHKTVSPETYPCNLCALTHGVLTMRPDWRRWLKSLPMPADFIIGAIFVRHFRHLQMNHCRWWAGCRMAICQSSSAAMRCRK